jgi:hypothetical protein
MTLPQRLRCASRDCVRVQAAARPVKLSMHRVAQHVHASVHSPHASRTFPGYSRQSAGSVRLAHRVLYAILMNKHIALAFALVALSSIQGCAGAADNHSVETFNLAGNGEARTLDFLNPIDPLRGNLTSVHDSATTLAVTQWQDYTRCFTQSDWNRGDVQVCPGTPSPKHLKLLGAECQDQACEVADLSGSVRNTGYLYCKITLHIKLNAPSTRLHVWVQDELGTVFEDWYTLKNDRM